MTFVIHKSHLRTRQVVLRTPEGHTLHSHNNARKAADWCRRHGHSYTFPMPRLAHLIQNHVDP